MASVDNCDDSATTKRADELDIRMQLVAREPRIVASTEGA